MSNFHKEPHEIGLQTDPDPTDVAIISLLQKKYSFSVSSFPTLGNDKLNEILKISSGNYSNGSNLQNSKQSSSSPLLINATTNEIDKTLNSASQKNLIESSSSATTNKLIYVPPQQRVNNHKDHTDESDSFFKQPVKEKSLYKIPQRSTSYKEENHSTTTNKGSWDSIPPQQSTKNDDCITSASSPQQQSTNKNAWDTVPQQSTNKGGGWDVVPPQKPIKNDDWITSAPPPQQSVKKNDWDTFASSPPPQPAKKDDWNTFASSLPPPPQQSSLKVDSWGTNAQQQQSTDQLTNKGGPTWNVATPSSTNIDDRRDTAPQQSNIQTPWGTTTTDTSSGVVADNSNNRNSWLKQAAAFEEELGTKNTTDNENTAKPPRDNYNEGYSNNNNGYEYQNYGKRGDMACYKCNETGHRAFECPNDSTMKISEEEAWEKMMKADAEKNIEDFKEMFEHYSKAAASETFQTIETKLRKAGCNTKIIALEREAIPLRKCLIDLQGNKEKKYLAILTMTDPNKLPKSSGNRAVDAEENFRWLADSGFMKDDFSLPVCFNCKQKGHLSKDCSEPKKEYKRTYLACQNCDSTEHITKYCKEERRDYESRRGGDRGRQSGGRECYKCGSSDHLARESAESAKSNWGVVENPVEGKSTGGGEIAFVTQSDSTSTWNNNNTSHGGYRNNTGNDAVPRW
ncbi:10859_t:CDS:2 [Entrophospora sp. SA101]|nr:12602_t:CDS:2 [Entrophospora sp. SA101]CAJ0637080.1 10859_t:CDS:2 [Entrophospora sp. SA101]CAJ0837364.1 5020_t:CDS:2 [Entrophospora sp. SA101]CAJ0837631.1 9042_t:CDS:2 [Entrophospora sp. SA101]CAJ0909360.1 772_t:CDS:2 [Entrophospora sp. SA101]